MQEFILSVEDVDRVVRNHLHHLDSQWPDSETFGPRKVHIVELIDGIRLGLHEVAKNNMARNDSAFEKAARKITNSKRELPKEPVVEQVPEVKSDMQIAFEKARESRRNRILQS